MSEIDALYSAYDNALKAGVVCEVLIPQLENMTVRYAPVGGDYAGDRARQYSRKVETLQEAANFINDIVTAVKTRPHLNELQQYQTRELIHNEFCGVNSYQGWWEFPNGYGVSIVRKNDNSTGVDFLLAPFHGMAWSEWAKEHLPDIMFDHELSGEYSLAELYQVAAQVASWAAAANGGQL